MRLQPKQERAHGFFRQLLTVNSRHVRQRDIESPQHLVEPREIDLGRLDNLALDFELHVHR